MCCRHLARASGTTVLPCRHNRAQPGAQCHLLQDIGAPPTSQSLSGLLPWCCSREDEKGIRGAMQNVYASGREVWLGWRAASRPSRPMPGGQSDGSLHGSHTCRAKMIVKPPGRRRHGRRSPSQYNRPGASLHVLAAAPTLAGAPPANACSTLWHTSQP